MEVDLKHVLEILDGGSWVSLAVIKANEQKGVAGEIMRFAKCRIARRSLNSSIAMHNTPVSSQGVKHRKNPNHAPNFTRNIETSNGRITTIHPLFIFEINGKAVI